MTAAKQFEALGIGGELCGTLQFALQLVAAVPVEQLQGAIVAIERAEAFGPFTDPTFFVRTPEAFDNGRQNKALFEALVRLRQLLPDPRSVAGADPGDRADSGV